MSEIALATVDRTNLRIATPTSFSEPIRNGMVDFINAVQHVQGCLLLSLRRVGQEVAACGWSRANKSGLTCIIHKKWNAEELFVKAKLKMRQGAEIRESGRLILKFLAGFTIGLLRVARHSE
jgi:hypothetical protein